MEESTLPDFLERGEPARLIPIVSEGSKEQRAVSVLLATMQAVGEFGRALAGGFGGPSGKSAKVQCYTEVVLKTPEGSPKLRPDGLIVVEQGSKRWAALVEAKIGKAELDAKQIEEYIDRAKDAGIDALVTISNQYAGPSGGHPIVLDGRKSRSISLHHAAWMSLVTQAILLIEREGIDDTERAFIIREMIRFFRHDGSGVLEFAHMGPEWSDLCFSVQQGLAVAKDGSQAKSAVADWIQLTRYLEVPLSLAIRHPVSVRLARDHATNPDARTSGLIETLAREAALRVEFDIPDAASRLNLVADLKRRVLIASMIVKAPTDKSRASACVTWLLRQLDKCTDPKVTIRAVWPRRIPDTMVALVDLRTNRDSIIPPNIDDLPTSFEISRTLDLGANFKSARKFVEAAETLVVDTYRHVGQYLQAWQPPAPKVKPKSAEESTETMASAAPAAVPAASSEDNKMPTTVAVQDPSGHSDP